MFFLKKKGPDQYPISMQLYAAIQCLGFYGNASGVEIIADKNGLSNGFVEAARDRVCAAFVSMIDKVITWPEAEERRDLCEFSRFRFGFPNCFFYSR